MAFSVITLVLITSFTKLTIQTCHHDLYRESDCNNRGWERICGESYKMTCYAVASDLNRTQELAVRKIEICLSNIESLDSKLFSGFDNVQSISMIGVNITNIEPYSFYDLSQLVDLHLSNNCIEILSTGSLRSLSLNTVDLSNNNISSIERDSFVHLNTLLMTSNKIVDVYNLMADCRKLMKLDLSYNFIRELKLVDGCLSLLDLDVSHNEITTFAVTSDMPLNLSTLYLSSNKLYNISITNLRNLNNLSTLDLSHNPLFQENNPAADLFQNTINLKYLNLSSTGIQKITVGTFTNLFKLVELDLSHNNLSVISTGIFHDTSSLNKLYINNNRLVRFQYEPLKNLQQIDLNSNRWTCDTLVYLISILKIDDVHIEIGNTLDVENIHGISCIDPSEHASINTSTNITKQEEEYRSVLNNLTLSIQQLIHQQENGSNILITNHKNESDAYWGKINQEYKKLLQIVETNVQDVTHKIINILNLTQNANRSQFNDANFELVASNQWNTLATNFTELLGKDSKTFLEEIKNIFNTTLSKLQNNFEETINTVRKNIMEDMRNIFEASLTKIQVNFQQIVRTDRKSSTDEIRNILNSILSTIQQSTNNGLFSRQIFNESDDALSLKRVEENVNVPNQNYQPLVIGVYGILAVLVVGLICHLVTKTKLQRMIKPEPREDNLLNSMPV